MNNYKKLALFSILSTSVFLAACGGDTVPSSKTSSTQTNASSKNQVALSLSAFNEEKNYEVETISTKKLITPFSPIHIEANGKTKVSEDPFTYYDKQVSNETGETLTKEIYGTKENIVYTGYEGEPIWSKGEGKEMSEWNKNFKEKLSPATYLSLLSSHSKEVTTKKENTTTIYSLDLLKISKHPLLDHYIIKEMGAAVSFLGLDSTTQKTEKALFEIHIDDKTNRVSKVTKSLSFTYADDFSYAEETTHTYTGFGTIKPIEVPEEVIEKAGFTVDM